MRTLRHAVRYWCRVFRGDRGHPVLFSKRFWPELLALETGAPRDVLRRYPEMVAEIEVKTDSILRDIDTPEQYHTRAQTSRFGVTAGRVTALAWMYSRQRQIGVGVGGGGLIKMLTSHSARITLVLSNTVSRKR